MASRRDLMGLALAGLAGLALLPAGAAAESTASPDDAAAALDAWLDAVYSGDPATVERVLAPEFQVLRSNGVGHDKAEYLEVVPAQATRPQPSDITATAHGGILVVRYILETNQTIEGITVTGRSPRLSVFRRENGRWLIVAHANFAPLS
jgi:hypothetical protein